MPRDSEETQLLAAGATEGGGGEGVVLVVQAGAARGGAEESADLFGEDAFALQARAPFADVELAAAQFADAVDDAGLFGRCMVVEPLEKHVFHGVRQAEDDIAGAGGAGGGGGGEDGGHFVVGEAGEYRRDHDAGRNAGGGELADGAEASGGTGGAGFEFAGELGVEGRDGNVDGGGLVAGEFGEEVAIAGDEGVFGDDGDGLAKFDADLEAAAGDAKVAFGGLIAVGDTAHRDVLRCPAWRRKFGAEKFGRASFHHDLGFEIEAAAPAKILVGGAGEAVGATVFAAAVGIETHGERDVGAVVFREQGFGAIDEELGARVRVRGVGAIRVGGERGEVVGVGREEERFETVGRIGVRAAAVDGGEGIGRRGGHGCTLLKNVAAPA